MFSKRNNRSKQICAKTKSKCALKITEMCTKSKQKYENNKQMCTKSKPKCKKQKHYHSIN